MPGVTRTSDDTERNNCISMRHTGSWQMTDCLAGVEVDGDVGGARRLCLCEGGDGSPDEDARSKFYDALFWYEDETMCAHYCCLSLSLWAAQSVPEPSIAKRLSRSSSAVPCLSRTVSRSR